MFFGAASLDPASAGVTVCGIEVAGMGFIPELPTSEENSVLLRLTCGSYDCGDESGAEGALVGPKPS